MPPDKLGAINFFGILVPGTYLTGILVMAVASVIELCGHGGHARTVSFVTQNTALSAGVFVFVSYLIGIIVRLFAPDYVDKVSRFYLNVVWRNQETFVTDYFPYKESLVTVFERAGMEQIPELMKILNAEYGKKGNTEFFNYCKLFIGANEPSLARQVQEAEAFIRFLSGTSLVLLIAFAIDFVLLVLFLCFGVGGSWLIYGVLVAVDILSLSLILARFKHQRRKEVIIVWSCVYLIVNGGIPGGLTHDQKILRKVAFFPKSAPVQRKY